MQRVFVVDQELRPFMPCRPAWARWLLTQHRGAGCVGASTPEQIYWLAVVLLSITVLGRHGRQMVNMTHRGLPRGRPKATSVVGGFRSGDLVQAVVPEPLTTAGIHVGTISVRTSSSCAITTRHGRIDGISIWYCRHVQRLDGYRYATGSQGASCPG